MQSIVESSRTRDTFTLLIFIAVVLTAPIWGEYIGAGYPDLLQKFAIFGLFAIGYNILFGLTGYLSFGHAAFLGVGSYATVWSFKLLSLNAIPAVIFAVVLSAIFAVVIGYLSLRRSGIYFSILTLAFAQMSYNMAYSVLTPITNGETGLQLKSSDPRVLDAALGVEPQAVPLADLFGITLNGYAGFYFCAAILILGFWLSMKIFRSPFGMKLVAIKSNQTRMDGVVRWCARCTLDLPALHWCVCHQLDLLWCSRLCGRQWLGIFADLLGPHADVRVRLARHCQVHSGGSHPPYRVAGGLHVCSLWSLATPRCLDDAGCFVGDHSLHRAATQSSRPDLQHHDRLTLRYCAADFRHGIFRSHLFNHLRDFIWHPPARTAPR